MIIPYKIRWIIKYKKQNNGTLREARDAYVIEWLTAQGKRHGSSVIEIIEALERRHG